MGVPEPRYAEESRRRRGMPMGIEFRRVMRVSESRCTTSRRGIFTTSWPRPDCAVSGLMIFRYTYATLLLMQGESPAYVKDQLDHSSIKMSTSTAIGFREPTARPSTGCQASYSCNAESALPLAAD